MLYGSDDLFFYEEEPVRSMRGFTVRNIVVQEEISNLDHEKAETENRLQGKKGPAPPPPSEFCRHIQS